MATLPRERDGNAVDTGVAVRIFGGPNITAPVTPDGCTRFARVAATAATIALGQPHEVAKGNRPALMPRATCSSKVLPKNVTATTTANA